MTVMTRTRIRNTARTPKARRLSTCSGGALVELGMMLDQTIVVLVELGLMVVVMG